jgi:pimeloyl-ACP methyl ester carboxylesterase
MKKLFMVTILTVLAISVPCKPIHAQGDLPKECRVGTLPTEDPKYTADQIVMVCIPDNWNQQLVVYAHGYVAVQEPLALPLDELTLSDGTFLPEVIMSLGYAFATSSYHKNGYAVEQAAMDLNSLVEDFRAGHKTDKVFITGASEGGLIATMLLEKYPGSYDAGLALCGPVGGAPYQIKYLGDFRVVFDYFFPGVFPFGMADIPANAYLDWDATYVPAVGTAVESSSFLTGQLFGVTNAALDPADPSSAVETSLSVLFYSIWATNDIIDVAGGQPYGNVFRWYTGSSRDLALNKGVERVRSDSAAVDYMKDFYEPTGRLSRPLVTLHTTLDGQVPFSHEVRYLARTVLSGKGRFLTVLPVTRYGHCNFTLDEILGAFGLMILKSSLQ